MSDDRTHTEQNRTSAHQNTDTPTHDINSGDNHTIQ